MVLLKIFPLTSEPPGPGTSVPYIELRGLDLVPWENGVKISVMTRITGFVFVFVFKYSYYLIDRITVPNVFIVEGPLCNLSIIRGNTY